MSCPAFLEPEPFDESDDEDGRPMLVESEEEWTPDEEEDD